MHTDESISLEELIENNPISIRAFGICMRNGLITLKRLIYHYRKYKTFKNLRGCGDKVEQELISLIANYSLSEKELQKGITIEAEILASSLSYNDLTPFKRSTLNHHIDYLLSNLSPRSLNCLNQKFSCPLAKALLENVIETNFDFRSIRNVGEKTVQELNSFRNRIENFIATLQDLPDEELSKEYTRLILKNTFPKLSDNFGYGIQELFDENGKIKIFTLINKILVEGVLFNTNEQKIFEATYFLAENGNKPLEQIATELLLTKERVRQLKNNLDGEIENHFSFILNLNINDIYNYEISNSSSIIIIDEEISNSINTLEGTRFTKVFHSIILGLLLKNSHSVLGDNETISGKGNYSNTIRYKNCYIIVYLRVVKN